MRYWGFAVSIWFGVSVGALNAQTINEVSPSPTSKQWIEIYNNTSSSIDLTQYKILDAGASVNGHAISAISGGSSILPAGAYGIVAKDTTSVSGTYVFKSALGIKTTGDTISLKTGSSAVDTLAFPDSSSFSGNSYQKTDSGWIIAAATPGAENSSTSASTTQTTDTTEDTNTTSTNVSSHYSFIPISDFSSEKLKVGLGRDRLGYVGIPVSFKALSNTNDPNTNYFWNFGDGEIARGHDATHTYVFPGKYTVVVNAVLFDNEAVARVKVEVIDPQISVASADDSRVVISNKSKYEVNLFGWRISHGMKIFEFPKDTIIPAGGSVAFPASVTKLNFPDVVLARSSDPISPPTAAVQNKPDPEKQKAIDEISYKLAHAQKQLFDMLTQNEIESAATTSIGNPTQTASAMTSAVATSSWLTTLKKFFKLTR